MKLELICVVSLRTKSEEKLPLDNILLFLSFEIARSYDLFNITALSGENPKRRNTEHRGTEGPTHWWVKTPKSHDTSYPSLRRNIISYHFDTSCNRDIYIVLISYTLIIIIHHPGIISHHADIMTSCWYIVWYHIIWYRYFNCWCNIIRIYRSHGNNLHYQN